MAKRVVKSDKEWKEILTPEAYLVLRKSGTERAFTGKYNDHYEKGIYVCAACGSHLGHVFDDGPARTILAEAVSHLSVDLLIHLAL